MRSHFKLTLFAVSCGLADRCMATNSTNDTSDSICSHGDGNTPSSVHGPPFNATGTVSINVPELGLKSTEPWFLTVGFKDNRTNPDTSNSESSNGYLSIPKDLPDSAEANHTGACLYYFEQLDDAKSSDKENGSCEDLLSKECVQEIGVFTKSFQLESSGCPGGTGRLSKCGNLWSQSSIGNPLTLAVDSCHADKLSGVDAIPEGYVSVPIFGQTFSGDENGSFENYDKRIKQRSTALLIAFNAEKGSSNGDIAASPHTLCVEADHVAEGSRSSATGLQTHMAMLAISVTIAATFVYL